MPVDVDDVQVLELLSEGLIIVPPSHDGSSCRRRHDLSLSFKVVLISLSPPPPLCVMVWAVVGGSHLGSGFCGGLV